MPRQSLTSASYFGLVLGRKDEKGGGRGIFKNPLQRYEKFLEYANFVTQKMTFFDISSKMTQNLFYWSTIRTKRISNA